MPASQRQRRTLGSRVADRSGRVDLAPRSHPKSCHVGGRQYGRACRAGGPHRWPSQYRLAEPPAGSGYQPAGGKLRGCSRTGAAAAGPGGWRCVISVSAASAAAASLWNRQCTQYLVLSSTNFPQSPPHRRYEAEAATRCGGVGTAYLRAGRRGRKPLLLPRSRCPRGWGLVFPAAGRVKWLGPLVI